MAKKILVTLFLVSLSVIFASPMIKSGLPYSFGLGFWGPNGHDGIWHLSLVNHIGFHNILNIPLPVFSGENLHNYHPFFNILVYLFSVFTRINPSFVIFQLFPLLISFLTLLLSYKISQKLFSHNTSHFLLPLFLVFSNSFGWIITLLRSFSIGGESLFWSMQSPSFFFNPPLALSFLFVTAIIYLSLIPPSTTYFFITFLLLTLLPITKVYSVPFIFTFYGLYSIYSLVKYKTFKPFIVLTLSLVTGYLLYRLYNTSSSSLIRFSPFWFVLSMLETTDRLNLPRFASAIHSFTSGHSYFKLIILYLIFTPVFIIGNFGTRILGITALKLKYQLHLFLLPAVLISIFIPLLLVQSGTPWNTVQFMYYALFFFTYFFVNFLDRLKTSSVINRYFIILLVVFNLIPSVSTYLTYFSPTPPSYLPHEEVSSLTFLSSQPKGTVLTYPYDKYTKNNYSSDRGLPLWLYEDTSYVSAYSLQPTFVADAMNLANSGYDWQYRQSASNDFFKFKDIYQDRGFLVNNRISYIYLLSSQAPGIEEHLSTLSLTKIFNNSQVRIYQVQR